MPVTPLHVGPGVLIKSLGGRHVSLTVFTLAQVTMDLEVLGRLVFRSARLHGFTNSLLGATVVLFVTVPIGKPLCEYFLRSWNRQLSPAQAQWFTVEASIPWRAAWVGGVLGAYSHAFLDAMMHWDARLWAPMSEDTQLIDLLSVDQLNVLCLVLLAAGLGLMATAMVLRRLRRDGGNASWSGLMLTPR